MASARIGLDPRSIAAVREGYILKDHVVDVIRLGSLGAETTNAHCSRLVADNVADMYICAVAFDGDAILPLLLAECGVE